MLNGKNIIIGVSGSIAAYKSAFLVRLLIKAGANVKVMMTAAAKEFITPLTLSTLSKNPVQSEWIKNSSGEWSNHVELGLWADLLIIAPASANTLAKMAYGLCDNLLLATYLSAKCPVYFAPAMDLDMYKHPTTIENLRKLKVFGNHIIHPNDGELASGLYGEGRMAEPEEIIAFIKDRLVENLLLSGKRALVSAGPTYEAIDPVRFLGNHSSGKMGFAIAEALAEQRAKVQLVCGPNHLQAKHPNIKRIDVTSAEEMYIACLTEFKNADIGVMSAAVADYTPKKVAEHKIKKAEKNTPVIELVQTKDILAELGKKKQQQQFLIGFALETENEIENAKAKVKNKNLDFIVLNSLRDEGAGFKADSNKITIIDKDNKIIKFKLKSKQEVAADIVKEITERLKNNSALI